jgi:hypothetical protein
LRPGGKGIFPGLISTAEPSTRFAGVSKILYIKNLLRSGGCDEGPSYWFAAGGSVFDTLEILESATGGRLKIYDEPLIGKMASYIYKMHIAENYFVDFADADPKFSGDGLMVYRFGKAVSDEKLAAFGLHLYAKNKQTGGESFQRPRRLSNLLAIKDLPAAATSYEPVREAWFSDIEAMTARTGSGLFLAAHAGHNGESHNHNDVGDFIVYLGGEPVIIDAGRGNYTAKTFSSKRYELWFTRSEYHNLPIVNNFGQGVGTNYTAVGAKPVSNKNETSRSADIAKSYPKEAGIEFWNRTVKLDRAVERIEISDDYSLTKKPSSLRQVFMTVCEVDLTEPGKIKFSTPSGKRAVLAYSADEWTASVDRPSTEGPEYSSFASKWSNRPISRIILTAVDPRAKDSLRYAILVDPK